jgi:DNA invertase Pin-like site-specific DNA recombinase
MQGLVRAVVSQPVIDRGVKKSGVKSVERIFSEKVSGVAAKRPQLERLLDELEAGDVPVVTKLDRLARAGFKLFGDTCPHGRLMLTVLSGVAGFERSSILQRTNEGRARAMAEGTRFGR